MGGMDKESSIVKLIRLCIVIYWGIHFGPGGCRQGGEALLLNVVGWVIG